VFLPCIIFIHKRKNKHTGKTAKLHQVEAGPIRNLFKQQVDLLPMVDVNVEDITMDPNLQYFIVKNQCMQEKGISDGDIIGVRMFDDENSVLTLSKKDNILLIYINDERFKGYKIREQGDMTSDGLAFNTYHYKGGTKSLSSRPHAIESIKGVVTEVYQRQYVGSLN
jgi:hypothetical protein